MKAKKVLRKFFFFTVRSDHTSIYCVSEFYWCSDVVLRVGQLQVFGLGGRLVQKLWLTTGVAEGEQWFTERELDLLGIRVNLKFTAVKTFCVKCHAT